MSEQQPSAAARKAAREIRDMLLSEYDIVPLPDIVSTVARIIEREMPCAELAEALRHVGILIENIIVGGDAWKDAIHRVKDRMDAALAKYEARNA